jgi:DNA-binding winged helix-turn-helix (wHTH) protein
MKTQRRISLEAPLRDSPEEGIGVVVPAVLSDRIDALVVLVEEAGERTSRKELIAALILATSVVSDELATTLRRYRRAAVRDALLRARAGAQTILLTVRQPGPRPRRRR